MTKIYEISRSLQNGATLEQALQLAGRIGLAAHIEGDMLVLDGVIMTTPEGGEPEVSRTSSIDEALEEALEEEAGYRGIDEMPCVVSVKAFHPAFSPSGDMLEAQVRWRTELLQEPEPPCSGPGHEWTAPIEVVGGVSENPGVWANSDGGVSITEICPHCGMTKYTDTIWTHPATGTTWEGVVRYDAQAHREAALQWAASLAEK